MPGKMVRTGFVPFRSARMVVYAPFKAGSTSLKAAYLESRGRPAETPNETYPGLRYHHVNWLIENGWSLTALCRNPYDRLESCWRSKIVAPRMRGERIPKRFAGWDAPFDVFVRRVAATPDGTINHHAQSQTWPLHCIGVNPNHIVHLERLGDEWGALMASNPSLPAIPHRNSGDRRGDLWTPRLRDMVYERYRGDFETFGYER